ncbi:hypothetical protein BEWA_011000 [Theileria equi strain WA]|uniref:Uncharacterized protein n=1 Tax=Theileria equi strain WA TaxID=1537102 RepID=L0B1D6_THEEQ|nr:hypothetical protein BEWA_011000 [Theileria equi strain WA]AFZ81682.1 hypothetical protein BEWA_011000 [Theileria equi strain WA]|eukprot:XP_004831348.1 hypothetical protein BEWA_011000 [Theileria equi strain WA]
MKNNPYYKLPELDRKIREITILHPDVMENLGVYVIPIKREVEETKSNSDSTSQELHDGSITTDDTTQSHIDDLLQNTEMIKAMEPEEKLKYIPQLKHTIVYEILKNRDVLKKLSDKIGEEHGL